MPVADVSDLMSKRNLVQEAQGWMSLDLQKKEQARKELESKKKDALKPFDWEMADWGSDNPYFQEQLQDLSQDYYNHVYSMSPYLSINPGDMENCPPGSPCANAHKLKNTLDGTAGAFKSFQTRFQNDYDSALDLLGDKDSVYYNQDNLQALENAKGEWMKGFKPAYNQDGRLMAIITDTEKVPQKDENGNALYVTESGDGTTTNKDDAKIGDDGNPVQATADQEVEKMITLDEYYDKLGISKDKLKKNASANDWNPETFSELITKDSSFIDDGGMINKNNKNYKTTYNNLHGAIFGATDMYNPEDPEGSVLTANAAPIINMMRNDPSGNFREGSITKDQIIDYVIQNVMGYDGVDGDSSGGGFDMGELISRMSDSNHIGELSTYNIVPKDDGTYGQEESGAIAYEGMFTIEHGGKEPGQITSATFDPSEITLLKGDDDFRAEGADIAGMGQDLQVTYHDAYLCLWDPDQGKFLTKDETANLTDEQKAKCEYRPAIQVTFYSASADGNETNYASDWNGSGMSTDGSIRAIMPLDKARSQIQGDFSEKSSNFQKTEAMDELAKRKTEELRSGVIPDSSTGGTEGEESDQDTEDPDAFDPNDY